LDDKANASGGPPISTADSGVSVWVIPTNEELMIAVDSGPRLGAWPDCGRNSQHPSHPDSMTIPEVFDEDR
jgi:hypothetical protein